MMLCRNARCAASFAGLWKSLGSTAAWRSLSGSPQTAALSMSADAEELQKRCGDFLQICRENGGTGSVDLQLNSANGLAEIVINNYAKRNALSGKMMLDLERIITDLESWPDGKALLLYGEKDAFCSGGDLDFVQRIATPELGVQMSHFMQHTLTRLRHLPLVSVAVVRGAAHGGGAELCTACDYRVFTKGADVRFVQAKLGITTGWGGATRLARLMGPSNALYYLLSTETIPMSVAKTVGFAHPVTFNNSEGVEMSRLWLTDNILKAPVPVIRAYKAVMRRMEAAVLADAYTVETDVFRHTWGSPAHRDAIQTVLNKNAPAVPTDQLPLP